MLQKLKKMKFLLGLLVACSVFIDQTCSQLTADDRTEVLSAHNYVRSNVSPTAANMRRMVRLLTRQLKVSGIEKLHDVLRRANLSVMHDCTLYM